MVFGTAAANAAAQAPTAPPPGKQPSAFGGGPVPPPATSSAPKPNQTMVFGTAAANAARPAPPATPAPNPSQTLVFGNNARPAPPTVPAGPAVSAPEPGPSKNQTMMFGRTPAAKPIPKVTVGTVEIAGYAAGEDDKRTESTVRVELDAVQPGPTDAAAPAQESAEARHDRTQRYAMTDKAEGPVPDSIEDRHNRTVLFAMNPMQETTRPDATRPALAPAGEADASLNQTMAFGTRAAAPEPVDAVLATPPEGLPAAEPQATTLPNLPSFSGQHQLSPLSLELPPEPSFGPGDAQLPEPGVEDADVAALRSASNRRTTIAVVVFLVIALALGLTLVWYLFGRAIVSKESTEVRQKAQEALTTLRLDDAAAQGRAVEELRTLVGRHADSIEANAALVVALSVSADDARAEVNRQDRAVKVLQDRLRSSSGEAQQQLNTRVAHSLEGLAGIRQSADATTTSLRQALAQLLSLAGAKELTAEQRFELFRGQALAASVLGDTDAITLAEKCRQTGHGADNWAELALPEYAINGGSSFDDALRQLQVIQTRDNTFLRAYVLSARIHLLQNRSALADEDLSRVLSFHPEHDAARQLHELVASLAQPE
jgi:hypothetical protein